MSRGADYQFIPTDPEDTIIWITSAYEEIMGITVQPASPERGCWRWKPPSGREAMLFVYREHCLFVGDPADLDAVQNGRCPDRRCGRG